LAGDEDRTPRLPNAETDELRNWRTPERRSGRRAKLTKTETAEGRDARRRSLSFVVSGVALDTAEQRDGLLVGTPIEGGLR
jgi:hypothetical protein